MRMAFGRVSTVSWFLILIASGSSNEAYSATSLWESLKKRWKAGGKDVTGEKEDFKKPMDEFQRDVEDAAALARLMYTSPTAPQLTADGSMEVDMPGELLESLQSFVRRSGRVSYEAPDANMPDSRKKPSFLVSLTDDVQNALITHFTPVVQNWTGRELEWSNHYGIRCYGDGSRLSYHVDNVYQLASVIIPVVQEVSEPWLLHIERHEPGQTRIVNLEVGKALLYESYRLPHWRPEHLKGVACNLFLHWTLPATVWDARAMEAHEERLQEEL
eukprot:TRINITY_DN106003_c0_g1_i1.p1 TRINITY_DN106003_c0_g1~~TRINITY_DN106003_c0_g1_i1.p1  ORF type:complete len:273 (-),score=54.23 TRINITY_DN106003_c0_g1_i1:482-1300(-)